MNLEATGNQFHDARIKLMLEENLSLTQIYNRFHNPKDKNADITRLRELHVKMDNAVATAYGWSDLDLGHGFHETPQGVRFTLSELARHEVLSRLLRLNHERYEEEVKAGLHEKDKKKSSPRASGAGDTPEKLVASKRGRHTIKEQPSLPYAAEAEPQAEAVEAQAQPPATPAGQIGKWDQCVCLGCGRHLVGFSIEEHTQKVHGGKDPGYRKVGG